MSNVIAGNSDEILGATARNHAADVEPGASKVLSEQLGGELAGFADFVDPIALARARRCVHDCGR